MPNLNFAEAFKAMLEHYLSKRFYFLTDTQPVYKTVQKESTFFLGLSFLRVWPDFLASDFKFILAFRKLGLIGFVFSEPEGGFIFIILYNI